MHTEICRENTEDYNEQRLGVKECTQNFCGENTESYNEQWLGVKGNAHRQRDKNTSRFVLQQLSET